MGFGLSQAFGLGGGILGTVAGSYYGNKAASAERKAVNQGLDRLGAAKGEAISYQQPFYETGREALSPLTSLLLGKSYNSQTGEFTTLNEGDRMNSFLQSPGYQFRLSEGLKATQASQAARGGLLSGGAMKELTNYSQGLASDEYGNYINQLFSLSGMGQQAAGNMSNIATGMGTSMANLAYSGGMANANKYANISNFGYGIAGQGFGALMGSQGGGGQGLPQSGQSGGGTYNSSYGQNLGMNILGG